MNQHSNLTSSTVSNQSTQRNSSSKIIIPNKTPKPTCFHNLKSQLYLSDEVSLSSRHTERSSKGSGGIYEKQYSNIVSTSTKQIIDSINQDSIKRNKERGLSESIQNTGSNLEKSQNLSPPKQRKQSSIGKIQEKVISSHQIIEPSSNKNTSSSILQEKTSSQEKIDNQKYQQKKEGFKTSRENGSNSKNLINLENVLLVEDKLWTILESFRYLQHYYQESRPSLIVDKNDEKEELAVISAKKQADIALLCEEWWEITHEDNLNYLDRIFKDDTVRRSVRQSIILELLSVTICYAITSEKSSEADSENGHLTINTITNLKNLLFYTHQNFLVLIDVIIHRLPAESSHNIWAHSLQAILLNKSSRKLLHSTGKSKSGIADNAAPLLIGNNEAIINLLRNLCKSGKDQSMKTQLNRPVFQCTLGLLKKITKHSVSQVRELLFSLLEQFTTSLLQKQNQIINQKNNIVDEQDENDFLPVVYPPYLAPITQRQQEKLYTLVLDLDETLIHYFEMGSEGGHFLVRPGAEKFIKEMNQIYEVVIFTAAMQDYADWVLDQIDPNNYIKYRLYRQHATSMGPVFIKDLSKLGRDISRVIIVDNVAENFQLQPDNGIFIRSWFDDMTDTALEELGPLLKEIVKKQVPDVRVALRRFRDQMIAQLEKGISNPIMTLD